MAKKVDFKEAINSIIEEEKTENLPEDNVALPKNDEPFIIEKKQKHKINKKTFPIYMNEDMVNELDKICNKTGYTRNELINMIVSQALKNMQIR